MYIYINKFKLYIYISIHIRENINLYYISLSALDPQ